MAMIVVVRLEGGDLARARICARSREGGICVRETGRDV
jgi:hypothetical protein